MPYAAPLRRYARLVLDAVGGAERRGRRAGRPVLEEAAALLPPPSSDPLNQPGDRTGRFSKTESSGRHRLSPKLPAICRGCWMGLAVDTEHAGKGCHRPSTPVVEMLNSA